MHFATSHPSAARRPATRGFTLIELLTVIAIIGILAAIIIPTVGGVRSKARAIKCTSQLRAWSQAIRLFANDNKGNIALTLSVGDATGGAGPGKLYSSYFNAVRMDSLGTTGGTLDPMDFFFTCPSLDRTGMSTAAGRRSYAFVAPIGHKTVGAAGSMFGRTGLAPSLQFYNLDSAKTPSRLFLMLEQVPNDSGVVTATSSGFTDATARIKPLLQPNAGDSSLVRHNGVINVLYLDGHISSHRWEDIDLGSQPAANRATFAIRYTL